MMTKPVYTILVNTNGWRDTIECLESVLRSDYPDARIIVCDNGSSDGSVDRIREWAVGGEPTPPARIAALESLSCPGVAKPVPIHVVTRQELEDYSWNEARVLLVKCGANLGFTGANNVG